MVDRASYLPDNRRFTGSIDGHDGRELAKVARHVTDMLTRAIVHENLRLPFVLTKERSPTTRLMRSLFKQQAMLAGYLSDTYDSNKTDLEKASYGLVRMILLAHGDDRFMGLPTLSWDSSILIARWADHDRNGAADELQRYLNPDDDDVGPRPTKRRYKAAINESGDAKEEDGESDDAPTEKTKRRRPINKLTSR